jgi:pimeloyl-ACP methyl ester carboxylesterase
VLAILAARQVERAHLIGHDWGAAVAWVLAAVAPDHVDHLAAMSVGHPSTFLRTLQQRQLSWYMLLFQFPGIAERWLSEDDWAGFRGWARHPDADQVIADLEANGSLTPGRARQNHSPLSNSHLPGGSPAPERSGSHREPTQPPPPGTKPRST